MRYEWDDGHMDDGWGVAMLVTMLGFWLLITVVIVAVVVWSVRSTRAAQGAAPAEPKANRDVTVTAEQILAERLARGEIEADEYRLRLNALDPRMRP